MVVQWTQGIRSQTGRSVINIKGTKKVPCPQLDQISNEALDGAAKDFERIAAKNLKPACQAHCDPVRHEIDAAVVKMFGMPEDTLEAIAELRLMWCREPSVHGNNKTALELLAKLDAK